MPLNTQILRDGESLPLRWGDFHVAAMVLAATFDSGVGPFEDNTPPTVLTNTKTKEEVPFNYPLEPLPITRRDAFDLTDYSAIATTPLNEGSYELKGPHRFIDCADGEILELLPGDVLKAWRN
jgi:hypothetical protein